LATSGGEDDSGLRRLGWGICPDALLGVRVMPPPLATFLLLLNETDLFGLIFGDATGATVYRLGISGAVVTDEVVADERREVSEG